MPEDVAMDPGFENGMLADESIETNTYVKTITVN
jgi:hypothetical protein